MDARLLEAARALGGVFSTADAERAGVSRDRIEAFLRAGSVIRVRRGAFVLREALGGPDLPPEHDYLLRAKAVLRSRPAGDALSHHAAAILQGIDMWRCRFDEVDVVTDRARSKRVGHLFLHPAEGVRVTSVDGVRCVPVLEALAQIAARESATSAVCSIDSALHQDRVSGEELRATFQSLPLRGRSRALAALALVDARAESVGESRCRLVLWDLGFDLVSQQWIYDDVGAIGRVDFVVHGLVVVEFDGLTKYAGCGGKEALAAEKLRESRLFDAGYEIERVMWRDLDRPAELARRIRAKLARAAARRAA